MTRKFKTVLDRDIYTKVKNDLESHSEAVNTSVVNANTPAYSNLLNTNIEVGTVVAFTSNTIPTGWLLCNGLAISRTTYSALFTVIGTSHGSGDNLTTFNLPNYQGIFLRGVSNGSANDPNRTTRVSSATGGASGDIIGSYQDMDWKGFSQTNAGQNTTAYSHNNVYMGKSTTSYVGNLFVGWWSAPAAALGTLWDTSEIRPRNVYVNYIIKFQRET